MGVLDHATKSLHPVPALLNGVVKPPPWGGVGFPSVLMLSMPE